MDRVTALKILEKMKKAPRSGKLFEDWFSVIRSFPIEEALRMIPAFRAEIVASMKRPGELTHEELDHCYDLIGRTYVMEGPYKFDSYCIALEWKRPPEKKFYMPRRRVLKRLADDLQDLGDGRISFLSVSCPPRVGKLLSDNTFILTSEGWKRHGDLVVGDRVASPSGEFVKVTHVFPKNVANMRVHFTNGEYIDCHENHEWVVYDRYKHKERIMETWQMAEKYQIIDKVTGKRRYQYLMPLREPLQGEHKDLPVSPYTLGAWLGDGNNQKPWVCESMNDIGPIMMAMRQDGYPTTWFYKHKQYGTYYVASSKLGYDLRSVGMCKSHTRTQKHIPEIYFTASLEQRLELLAGLLDTDGTLAKAEHRYHFCTSDERLRDDFVALVSTFGWRCCVAKYEPEASSSGVKFNGPYWSIGFNPTMYIPCRLARKRLAEFSKPRKIAICGIERLETPVSGNCISVEGGVYCAGKTLIPTHNSTICIFFLTWQMGRYPNDANLMSGHSDKLTDGFYSEVLSILTDADTYQWNRIFPGIQLADKSSKNETVDLVKKKRFPTLTCRSVSGTLTGAVEVGSNGILYCDDLIEDLEESLSPTRLQAKYDAYLNQLKDRKKQGARELHVATRWNVMDVIGRIKMQYEGDPMYRFTVLPAVDEEGHSNFNYDHGLGFDDAYYADMKASIDDATWCAKYMGRPYVREGLLFPKDELLWYNGVLPEGRPDMVVMVGDIAWGGGDFTSAPVAYVYGPTVYIQDVLFNNGNKETTQPLMVSKVIRHKVDRLRLEANNGGTEYADSVENLLHQQNYRLNIGVKRAPSNSKGERGTGKLGRIIRYAPDIKRFYFVDDAHSTREYKQFMEQVCLFVQTGKNTHDDAPDSLAALCDELFFGAAKVETFKRPF